MKTPEQIADEHIETWILGKTWGDPRQAIIAAIEADRAQRDIYELIAEALDERVANDLYDDEQTERTKKAAARFRGENGGWEDDLWNKYIGPMLDDIEEL